LFDEIVPSAPTPLPAGTATIGTGGATTPTYYYASDVDISSGQTLTVNGPAVLVISGHLYVNGSIVIANSGSNVGSLEIHVAGDLAIDGNGITNNTKRPGKLSIISTSNGWDTYEMGTNTPFYGVIYTPYNALTVTNSQTIYGSIVAKSVTFSGSPTFHYDLNLRKVTFSGIDTPYAVANIRESGNP
jgi:hypothetical protein